MSNESTVIGIVGIIIGAAIYIKTGNIWPSLIPTLIGLALILFSKEEDKIEGIKKECSV